MKVMFLSVAAVILSTALSASAPAANFSGIADALPAQLGSQKATSELNQFTPEQISQLVGERDQVFDDYQVRSAASREYGSLKAEVFETKDQFGAFGLFTFSLGPAPSKNVTLEAIGRGGAKLEDQVVFWKANYFVRIVGAGDKPVGVSRGHLALARAIDEAMTPLNNLLKKPALLESLPSQSQIAGSERYFSGPNALANFVEHAHEMYPFFGDAQAALASYDQGSGSTPLKLLIVEYHTPQFATDALAQLSPVLESLPPEEQSRLIVKRTGNYIVEAANVIDRERAQALVDSVEYPYTVKWLRNPLWPTDDPFRVQKAAQMLISTFGLLGLILLTVGLGGAAFGTTVFLKRRKQQRQAFSDAGGMLRLDIDPFESAILGLPPKGIED
jgi:hypothetical protein